MTAAARSSVQHLLAAPVMRPLIGICCGMSVRWSLEAVHKHGQLSSGVLKALRKSVDGVWPAQALEVPGPGPYGQQSPAVTLQLLIACARFFMYKLVCPFSHAHAVHTCTWDILRGNILTCLASFLAVARAGPSKAFYSNRRLLLASV